MLCGNEKDTSSAQWILLTTTALVAFAGAAVAEVSFSGEATLGYNDDAGQGNTEGFYWEAELDVALSQELDNGVTAGAEFGFDISGDNDLGTELEASGLVLSLTSENAGLFFGDVSFAAETHWVATGSMVADGFSEADGQVALRGDVNFGGVDASVSYVIDAADYEGDQVNDLNQLSLGMTADLGQFSIAAAYQAASDEVDGFYDASSDDFNDNEVYGISVATTVAGATVRLAYADDSETNSLGVSASYPVGPVTLSGYYVVEDGSDDSYGVKAVYADGPVSLTANYEDRTGEYRYNIEGAYDLGNGLVAKAGYLNREPWSGEAFYVAGEYDLGGGAALLVSYAEANGTTGSFADDDEVGAPEYQIGTTVEVSFKF